MLRTASWMWRGTMQGLPVVAGSIACGVALQAVAAQKFAAWPVVISLTA